MAYYKDNQKKQTIVLYNNCIFKLLPAVMKEAELEVKAGNESCEK